MLTEENWRNFINESKYVSGIYIWIFQKPLKKIHDLLLENSNQRDSAWMHDIHGAATWRTQAPTVDVNTIVYKDAIVWVQRRSIDESIDESPIKLFKNELIIENCLMIIGR